MSIVLGLKIDVDTDRGTRDGVPNLLKLFNELNIQATFLFSLGPDNTGRALRRIFRPGFLRKVLRSNVPGMYPWQTLISGVFWPGPNIAKRHGGIMRDVRAAGHEIGIHTYDHTYWQDALAKMTAQEVSDEFNKAYQAFNHVFQQPALTAGTAGWQASAYSLAAYDAVNLTHASDCRGTTPFYPHINGKVFKTLQLPTTLPTLDELLGHLPKTQLTTRYLQLLKPDQLNIFTLHAEIEGKAKLDWFHQFLLVLRQHGAIFTTLDKIAEKSLQEPKDISICDFLQGTVSGRSGTLAVQGDEITDINQINVA